MREMTAQELVAFLEANGLDPDNIPARGSVKVDSAGRLIAYREYVRHPDPENPRGEGLLVPDQNGRALLTAWKRAPLTVPPTGIPA